MLSVLLIYSILLWVSVYSPQCKCVSFQLLEQLQRALFDLLQSVTRDREACYLQIYCMNVVVFLWQGRKRKGPGRPRKHPMIVESDNDESEIVRQTSCTMHQQLIESTCNTDPQCVNINNGECHLPHDALLIVQGSKLRTVFTLSLTSSPLSNTHCSSMQRRITSHPQPHPTHPPRSPPPPHPLPHPHTPGERHDAVPSHCPCPQ